MVDIGLTDLPKSGDVMAPPASPGTTPLNTIMFVTFISNMLQILKVTIYKRVFSISSDPIFTKRTKRSVGNLEFFKVK